MLVKTKKAQSILEYLLILAVIVAGVLAVSQAFQARVETMIDNQAGGLMDREGQYFLTKGGSGAPVAP